MITIYNCGRQFKGKSLINTLNDYVVLDIETTGLDPFFDEIIEIGAIKVINGECVANFSKLVKPSKPVSDFIVQLTGITNDMLRDSPSIDKVLPEFMEFVSDMTIIGHNVHFDINFIYDNSMQVLNKPFFNDFIDTLRLSRRLFTSLDNHKLDTVSAFLNIDTVGHHRALQDCQITQNVYEEIKRYLVNNKIELQELFAPKKSEKLKARNITTDNIAFDENHLFYKKNCVFTGALQIIRKQAMQIVADLGGFCQDNVTKDTNFLILGNYDYSSNEKSSKHKKAEKYIVQGQDIRILSENVFMDLIADKLKNKGETQMTENERINELLILVEKICEDDFVSPNEISKLQDWCDENFVDLIGGKFNDVAYALQNFLDNGEFCDDEKCKLLQTIKSLL